MKGRCILTEIIQIAKEEIIKLEKINNKIEAFLKKAPEGCLKWQNKNEKTYYYHQFKLDNEKWGREYIKKENSSLANQLAMKYYYINIKSLVEKQLQALKKFVNNYPVEKIDDVYEKMCPERKRLCTPIGQGVKVLLKQWMEEYYEPATMYSDKLKFVTEQGEKVRSKSELIIANLLYQYRDDILYKYEQPLEIVYEGKKEIIYPDFKIINIHTGKIKYFEHAGRMDDFKYANRFVEKMNKYVANDLLPGRDVVWSFETQAIPLDISIIKQLINDIISN